MVERELGSYRHDVLEEVGIRVSTIFRESSAMVNNPARYFETMAFWLDRTPAILWQSAGYSERHADRMHDTAVRWFSSPEHAPTSTRTRTGAQQ